MHYIVHITFKLIVFNDSRWIIEKVEWGLCFACVMNNCVSYFWLGGAVVRSIVFNFPKLEKKRKT